MIDRYKIHEDGVHGFNVVVDPTLENDSRLIANIGSFWSI